MAIDRKLLIGIAATAVLAAGGGYLIARMSDPHMATIAEEEGEHGEEGEEHREEGFVALKPDEAKAAGVELAKVERGGGSELVLSGRVTNAANAQSSVGAPLAGAVVELRVAPGSAVRKGTIIALIRSPEGAGANAAVDVARAGADAANAAAARDKALFDQGVIARQEWEATHAAALKAQAELRSAEGQSAAMGSPGPSGIATVRSPINGVVARLFVSPGAVLEDGAEIAQISDTSQVELVMDAPPSTVGLIKVGSRVEARWTGGPAVDAEVTGVAPGSSGSSGLVRARLIGAAPPAGTVMSARLIGGGGDVLTVPSEAVQTVDGKPAVFVAEEEGFRALPVTVGRTASGRTEITSGLEGEEQIAGVGAFLLKADLAKGEVEHED